MGYKVIKTIRNTCYLYEQWSYRIGSKVYTKCRCLGRADGTVLTSSSENVSSETDETEEKKEQPTTEVKNESGGQQLFSKTEIKKFAAADKSSRNTTALSIRIPLQKHSVSASALKKEVDLAQKSLEHLNIPCKHFPDITIKHGYFPRFKRRFKTGKYVVTIPWKSRGTRQKFKRSFSQAVANATLDAIGRHDPNKYSRIASAFDEEYRNSTKAISTYLRNTSPKGVYAVVALHLFKKVNKCRECLPQPEKLGMVDFEKRRGWREEATKLMSEVRRKGLTKVRESYGKELTKVRREVTRNGNEMNKYFVLSPRRARARKKFRAALAREQAQIAMQRKLKLVSEVLGEN